MQGKGYRTLQVNKETGNHPYRPASSDDGLALSNVICGDESGGEKLLTSLPHYFSQCLAWQEFQQPPEACEDLLMCLLMHLSN